MATYYKYVERNAKDRINWNEVGKSVSDMLNDEAKVRVQKKAEIDENSRQFGIELANAPVGDYDHGNNFINGFATDMTEYRRMQDNLLKTGQLSLGEYTRNRQNNTDGTKLTFDLATAYQEAYTEKMDRWENGESDYREVWEMEQVEGLANLRNTGSFINPTNGVISLAARKEDGGLDINNTLTAAEMYGNIKRSYNKYDVNKSVAEEVGFLGEVIEADLVRALRAGDVNTIQEIADKKLSPAYNQWEDDTVSSMMVNKNHISSALTTYKLQTDNGEFYTFTYSEDEFKNDKSGKLIYLDKSVDANGVPVFKPEQEGIVEDFFRNRIRSQIGSKESIQSAGMKQYAPQATAVTVATGNAEDELDSSVGLVGNLFYGTDTSMQASVESLRDQNTNIRDITRDAEGVTLKVYNPDSNKVESRTVSFYTYVPNPDYDENGPEDENTNPKKIGKLKTQEEFIQAASPMLIGVTDISQALERGNYNAKGQFNESQEIFNAAVDVEEVKTYDEALSKYVTNKAKGFKMYTDEEATGGLIEQIKAAFPELNITHEKAGMDKFQLTVPGSKLMPQIFTADFNYSSSGTASKEKLKIIEYILKAMPESARRKIIQSNKLEADIPKDTPIEEEVPAGTPVPTSGGINVQGGGINGNQYNE